MFLQNVRSQDPRWLQACRSGAMHDIGSLADGESIMQFHPRNPEHDDIENVELDADAVKLDTRILLIGPFYVLFVYFFISDIATSNMFSVTVAGAVGPGRVLANWRMSQIRSSRLGCLAENATSRVGCLVENATSRVEI